MQPKRRRTLVIQWVIPVQDESWLDLLLNSGADAYSMSLSPLQQQVHSERSLDNLFFTTSVDSEGHIY